ncbi:MAG: lipo-like protein [Pseudomonadota bacterium]|nr:lipo-like protein [Pseudomonadota bacterium]
MTRVGEALAHWLSDARPHVSVNPPTPPEALAACLRPGDVLLVEGVSRVSVAIKYLTQSTWSHAALYVGREAGLADPEHYFIEADLVGGVRGVGFGEYAALHTRICRPVGLSADDRERLVRYAVAQIGRRYDLKNVADLARYLLPTPPVPMRFRRRMIGLGSGDPTRAICSTLIAEAFHTIRYPILPLVERADDPKLRSTLAEQWRVRHHSLFTPRDFDASPYFQIVKPTLERGFDFHAFKWIAESAQAAAETSASRA